MVGILRNEQGIERLVCLYHIDSGLFFLEITWFPVSFHHRGTQKFCILFPSSPRAGIRGFGLRSKLCPTKSNRKKARYHGKMADTNARQFENTGMMRESSLGRAYKNLSDPVIFCCSGYSSSIITIVTVV